MRKTSVLKIVLAMCLLAGLSINVSIGAESAPKDPLKAPSAAKAEPEPTQAEKIKTLEAEIASLKTQLQAAQRANAVLTQQRNQIAAELLDSQARLALSQAQ